MKRLQQTRPVLGSVGMITLIPTDDALTDSLFDSLWHKIDVFERRFSRFLPDSELTRFNHAAGERVRVSSEFRDILTKAVAMSVQTGGLYNPFTLPALQRAGYEGSWPQPDKGMKVTDFADRHIASIKQLEITSDKARIPKGTALDFGGIGKGYLLDQLAAHLGQQLSGYWLSLGGDIICSGRDIGGKDWRIGIQDAVHMDEVISYVHNDNGRKLAIATSGVMKRKGIKRGKPWHHIIDPRSGESASTDVLAATVIANDATSADVYAKCLVIVGSQTAEAMADKVGIRRAVLQLRDAQNGTVVHTKVIGADT